jgi:CheY-like chemotaxis protein
MQYSQTILLVDDDIDDHEFFSIALNRINDKIRLLKAENGQHALKLLEEVETLPDFVFLDINMPAIDGKQFLRLVKTRPELIGLHIIMYTTSSSEHDKEETLQLGAKQFITKPDTIEEIVKKISYILKK